MPDYYHPQDTNRMSTTSLSSFYSSASTSPGSNGAPDDSRGGVPISQPPQQRRNNSVDHNKAMRELMARWGALPSTPPQCQSVMSSSWSNFKSSRASSKSSDDMKASVLWADNGTTPDFNPPMFERVYLGVDQPACFGGGSVGPQVRVARRGYAGLRSSQTNSDEAEQEQDKGQKKKEQATKTATTTFANLATKPAKKSEPKRHAQRKAEKTKIMAAADPESKGKHAEKVSFCRSPIQTTSTTSLLTKAIRASSGASTQEQVSPATFFAQVMENRELSASALHTAFDSDSEDDAGVQLKPAARGGATRKRYPVGSMAKSSMAKTMGRGRHAQKLTASMLPSAFDSDSDEEGATPKPTTRKYTKPAKTPVKKKLTASMLPSAFDSDSEDDMMGLEPASKAPKHTKPTTRDSDSEWEDEEDEEDGETQ